MLQTILNAVDFSMLEQGYKVGLDWLGQFARVIIEGVGIIGLGIVVFSLVLKAITLPFDIYQRVKMRKQTLIMRDMKDDLEKLQKQYAGDKTTYNQKMMELYKKNGYSMFAACLPMILSLVIIIVAFQGFRAYSQYANLDLFVGMSNEYNAAILKDGVVGPNFTDYIDDVYAEEKDQYLFAKPYRLTYEGVEDDENVVEFSDGKTWTESGVVYSMFYVRTMQDKVDPETGETVKDGEGNPVQEEVTTPYLQVRAEDPARYLYYIYNLQSVIYKEASGTFYLHEEYKLDMDVLYAAGSETKAAIDGLIAADETGELPTPEAAAERYVSLIGARSAHEWYTHNTQSFLWVKNVWYPDVSYNHPIPSYGTFKSNLNVKVTLQSGEKRGLASVLGENNYNNLTRELAAEKSAPNGYFILIILSIGAMVLSQLLTMKSQKESNQYQTVDGQGARTQKIMLVVMPLIYAIFAFMYSAAFSIYMTMSSLLSLAVTLIINFILGITFKKKEENKIKEQYGRTFAWMEKKNQGKTKAKDKDREKPAKNRKK